MLGRGRLGGRPRAIRSWLGSIRARDATERRQAYLLQVALLVLAAAFLLGAVSNATRPASSPGAGSGYTNLVAAAAMILLITILRRGYFRAVAAATVILLTLGFAGSLAATEPLTSGTYLALLMVPIVLAGLTLSGRALGATLVGVVLAGYAAANGQAPAAGPRLIEVMGNFFYACVFIAAVVYGFGGTLRDALGRVTAHELELETRRLELEETLAQLRTETDERLRLEGQLSQNQRLESIGRLAGGVAHDFNNLLTAIIGYTNLLEEDVADLEAPREDVAGIRAAAEQAAALTKQLLAFSRSQELRQEVVDLSAIVTAIAPLLRRLLGERIALVTRPADHLWGVLADRAQLEAVIVNLAANARDAMPGGGTLTIETGNVQLDETYGRSHAEVTPGPYAMIAVSDTGGAMDTDTLSHIFEPFFTTKDLGKGTGLGLATVYGTVRQTGGHIWVYSEPDRGTSFKIYLPRTDQQVELVAPAIADKSPAGRREGMVLLAEDEELVRTMLETALRRAGYRVVAVASGEAALAYLRDPGAEISVLVSDVVMPGMSGPELLEQVRSFRPLLPAIFMTGYTAAAMEQRPIPGDVTLLEKPFTAEQLQRAIEAAVAGP
jgi:signal transduction histidine kinase/CheY-like chemotaxis protein